MVRGEEKGLALIHRVDAAVPACLVGDHGRLRQVLTNLVGNAIKFCQQGHVTVDVGLASQESDDIMLHVRVTDTGIGIAEEACKRIFNQFEQADSSTTRKFGGTGLGLAISKKLVELMDGNIWVESRLGVGSCFNFTARFQLGDEAVLPSGHEDAMVSCQIKQASLDILVADDVEINRALVQAVLEPYGYRITFAENGRKALEAFESTRFDLVLMDIQMPEMDGLQATRAIRQFESSQNRAGAVPIIAMTAFAGNEDRQVCLDAGMDDYLTKPIKSVQLMQTMNKFCSGMVKSAEELKSRAAVVSEPNVPMEAPEEPLAVFDKKELLERLGGRDEMVPRFVGLFCKGVLPEMEGLAAALSEGDADKVRRHAHAIKGSSGNIAARRMHRTAGMIEKAAKEGDIAEAPQRFALLQSEYKDFVEATGASEISATK